MSCLFPCNLFGNIYIYIYVYHDNKTTNNYIDIQTYVSLDMCNIYIYTFILPCIIYVVYYCNIYIYIYIWATVNIWYIAPSHQFLKSVLSFSTPLLNFQKIMMSPILLSNLNFGSSSYGYGSIPIDTFLVG